MYTQLLLALAGASAVIAAPAQSAPSITQVLQYALSLEYLENSFYTGALEKYDAQAFIDSGFPDWVRGRFEQISENEQTHVKFLQGALGASAPQPCNYSFPYTDPKSFVTLSMGIEGVGAAAYLGASKYITDPDTLLAAASILSVEQRQVGWVSSAVLKHQPWDGAFQTPLTINGAYSLASKSRAPPQTRPFRSQPSRHSLYLRPRHSPDLAWFNGLEVVFTNIDTNGAAQVPSGLHGTVYVGVVSSDQTPLSDADMVSGLAIMQFPYDSMASETDNQ